MLANITARQVATCRESRTLRRSSCHRSQASRSEHITPILRDLHWLPIRQWIMFKTAVLVLQVPTQHGSAVPTCLLRTDVSTLPVVFDPSVPVFWLFHARTRTNYGDRSFAVYGPRVWNSLPDELRSPDTTLITFRNKLKTLL